MVQGVGVEADGLDEGSRVRDQFHVDLTDSVSTFNSSIVCEPERQRRTPFSRKNLRVRTKNHECQLEKRLPEADCFQGGRVSAVSPNFFMGTSLTRNSPPP